LLEIKALNSLAQRTVFENLSSVSSNVLFPLLCYRHLICWGSGKVLLLSLLHVML